MLYGMRQANDLQVTYYFVESCCQVLLHETIVT